MSRGKSLLIVFIIFPLPPHFRYLHGVIAEDVHDLDCNFAPTRQAFTKYALKNRGYF
ncbi:hypothetical protein K8R42_01105 [bacterium]|nr:hypothetical protein [bacterium]